MNSIVANCKLPPAADANLHYVVADLSQGMSLMRGEDPQRTRHDGAALVHGALRAYAKYFDDPDWKPEPGYGRDRRLTSVPARDHRDGRGRPAPGRGRAAAPCCRHAPHAAPARARLHGCRALHRHADARAVERQHVDLAAEHALDGAQAVLLVGRHQRQRLPGGAGAAGAADAVHVVLGHVRQFVVHDLRQLVDVEAARGDVGRDQHLHLVVLEVGERLGARVLRLVAVDRGALDAVLRELLGQAVGAVLGAREHQRLRRRVAFAQQVAQHGALLALLHEVHAVLDELGRGVARARPRR